MNHEKELFWQGVGARVAAAIADGFAEGIPSQEAARAVLQGVRSELLSRPEESWPPKILKDLEEHLEPMIEELPNE